METAKVIGQRLRDARLALGMSQDEVGKRIGLTQVGYGAFERGETLISIEYLITVARLFDKPVVYFIGLPAKTIGDLAPTILRVVEIMEKLDAEGRSRVLDFAEYQGQQRAHDSQ